jgi:hypothetical protein
MRSEGLLPILVSCAALWSCASDDEVEPDLPPDWQGAARIEHFEQFECSSSAYDGPKESIEATAAAKAIEVVVHFAHFRCEQTVEGYLRPREGRFDVLIQPVDMSPKAVAMCDCLYEIALDFAASTGVYDVTIHRRWDHLSGNDEPLVIGTSQVSVE